MESPPVPHSSWTGSTQPAAACHHGVPAVILLVPMTTPETLPNSTVTLKPQENVGCPAPHPKPSTLDTRTPGCPPSVGRSRPPCQAVRGNWLDSGGRGNFYTFGVGEIARGWAYHHSTLQWPRDPPHVDNLQPFTWYYSPLQALVGVLQEHSCLWLPCTPRQQPSSSQEQERRSRANSSWWSGGSLSFTPPKGEGWA